MKVPRHLVEARRQQLAGWMQQHGHASLQEVCARFSISEATARRDLAALAGEKQIVRTYGGALAEYNQRFASFLDRQAEQAAAKAVIARKALRVIQPGQTIFLDAGTTLYAIAEALAARPIAPIEVVTNSLPVANLLAAVPEIRLHLLGGELLYRQSVLLGRAANAALKFYSIDHAFVGAEGADASGAWNSEGEVVEFQRDVLRRAASTSLCLDRSKLGRTAPAFFAKWAAFRSLISDATPKQLSTYSIPSSLL